MKTIVYYVSGHGFGHASRACQVVEELSKMGRRVVVRTMAPAWFFAGDGGEVIVEAADIDSGPAQIDCLTTDLEGTFKRFSGVIANFDKRAEEEAQIVKRWKADAVVCDISPLGVAAGSGAGVPTFVVANFLWDWILEGFAAENPAFTPMADFFQNVYRKSTKILRTPLSGGLERYTNVEDISLIAKSNNMTKEEARHALGVSMDEKFALVSLGGIGAGDFFNTIEERVTSMGLFTLGEGEPRHGRMIRFERGSVPHSTLLAACDVVIGKLGYGLCSELVAARRPILYTPRLDFLEYNELDKGIRDYVAVEVVSRKRYFGENLDENLKALLKKKQPATAAKISGAADAAKIINAGK